ncbi:hypothetical protein [Effusibacillus lacus]|uniref:Uncharacterized protein n=1 Tax=Effusibacillus lacus TaxID=1348429 RepID=A0A292YCC7_9BACL|nr:hypothetical protein [Effusibacillus lacus]TCS75507.1 hypothetical protein EDD64_10764 [Effusibacillus lacus]GAX88972.1 hypothetical protein EFBL_0586 [Effusibacillus lacus]
MAVSPKLREFWNKSLSTMPKKEVQAKLRNIGVNLPTGNLSEDETRKLLYGFLARLDEPIQEEAIQMFAKQQI